MAFDPDAYLASKQSDSGFDPDAYLASKEPAKPTLAGKIAGKLTLALTPRGSIAPNPAAKAKELVSRPFEAGAAATAESIGRAGYPKTGAALGTGIAMIPDLALTLGGGMPKEVPNQPGSFAKGLMGQMESSSGGLKGSLEAAYKDPGTILSKGTEKAGPIYARSMERGAKAGANIFDGVTKNTDIIDKAIEYTNGGGKLEPTEALILRKAIDQVSKSKIYSKDILYNLRSEADSVVKSNKFLAVADKLYRKGALGRSLRQIMPQNKLGGASAFKMALIPATSAIGGAVGGKEGAKTGALLGATALSPAVQGLGVTAAGIVAQLAKNPQLMTAVMDYLNRNKQNTGQ